VEQVGKPADIYENPESAFVANFIGVSNIYLSDVVSPHRRHSRVEDRQGPRREGARARVRT